MSQIERPRIRWQKTRSWNGCHCASLGLNVEYNPMGTTIDPKTQTRRPWTVYKITLHLLTRKLTVAMNVWTD